jgi:hypothetical protein
MSGVALTDAEWNAILGQFPLLAGHRNECRKTDEPTDRYNCIAWSVGVEGMWIDPLQPMAAFVDFCKHKLLIN